jgi:hypothetical protein
MFKIVHYADVVCCIYNITNKNVFASSEVIELRLNQVEKKFSNITRLGDYVQDFSSIKLHQVNSSEHCNVTHQPPSLQISENENRVAHTPIADLVVRQSWASHSGLCMYFQNSVGACKGSPVCKPSKNGPHPNISTHPNMSNEQRKKTSAEKTEANCTYSLQES